MFLFAGKSIQSEQVEEAATPQRTALGVAGNVRLVRGVALRGQEDAPTDAVRDYCLRLGEALTGYNFQLDQARMPWVEQGWVGALSWLWHESARWKGQWVLIQYTALQWSRRGFPLRLLGVLGMLKIRRARLAVVFHDALPYPGRRVVDGLRRKCQTWVMRWTYWWADSSVVTVPIERVSWLPRNAAKCTFVPVGSTLLGSEDGLVRPIKPREGEKTVVVFGVTGGGRCLREVGDIVHAVRTAAQDCAGLRLVVLGRGSEEAREYLEAGLQGSGVGILALGIIPAPEINRVFGSADVLLFVRGHVSSRRSSAIAALACGLPLVGYAGKETDFPITAAGVILVPEGDRDALAAGLARVLTDDKLQLTLREKSLAVQREHFAWNRIADRFLEILR